MCWPPGKAERRYAGVTHVDVTDLSARRDRAASSDLAVDPARRRSPGWAITPTRCRPTPPRPRSPRRTSCKVIDAAAALGVGRGELVRRPRPEPLGRRELAAVPGGLAAARRPRRGHGREDRHRELPDALHPRRVARRQEPGDHPGDLAADVRRHPQPELRPELRPLALRLAADGLHRAAGRVPGPDLPRPRQGRPDRPRGARRSTASSPIPSSGTRPSSPAWATSAGAPSSRRSATSATTATSPSRSRTAPSRARSSRGSSR